MPSPAAELAARCGPIELLVVDVDGVLTDGVIALDDHGVETKHFHVRDGSALALWQKAGRRAAILSGRRAAAVEHRAAELGITRVIQGAAEKLAPFRALLAEQGLEARQVCYMGDDLADLPVLAVAGLAACPADAAEEVRAAAHLVARAPGGRGAVREVVEIILKHQGAWDALVARVRAPARDQMS
jgi:3-deoxy-D-manno-octulosonate 8-phosphate phosphatase (KDO 8-P phosphatase)